MATLVSGNQRVKAASIFQRYEYHDSTRPCKLLPVRKKRAWWVLEDKYTSIMLSILYSSEISSYQLIADLDAVPQLCFLYKALTSQLTSSVPRVPCFYKLLYTALNEHHIYFFWKKHHSSVFESQKSIGYSQNKIMCWETVNIQSASLTLSPAAYFNIKAHISSSTVVIWVIL